MLNLRTLPTDTVAGTIAGKRSITLRPQFKLNSTYTWVQWTASHLCTPWTLAKKRGGRGWGVGWWGVGRRRDGEIKERYVCKKCVVHIFTTPSKKIWLSGRQFMQTTFEITIPVVRYRYSFLPTISRIPSTPLHKLLPYYFCSDFKPGVVLSPLIYVWIRTPPCVIRVAWRVIYMFVLFSENLYTVQLFIIRIGRWQ